MLNPQEILNTINTLNRKYSELNSSHDVPTISPSTITAGCQLCKRPFKESIIDGRTSRGPWAFMCFECFKVHGMGLGTGFGQVYDAVTGKQKQKI